MLSGLVIVWLESRVHKLRISRGPPAYVRMYVCVLNTCEPVTQGEVGKVAVLVALLQSLLSISLFLLSMYVCMCMCVWIASTWPQGCTCAMDLWFLELSGPMRFCLSKLRPFQHSSRMRHCGPAQWRRTRRANGGLNTEYRYVHTYLTKQ